MQEVVTKVGPVRRAALGVAAATGLLSLTAIGVAGAQSPQPAFYTWQAPGGGRTSGQRVIALTFDDGPGPYTPQVLSVLEQYHVPATFFEIGEHVAQYPQYTQMVAAAGYPVENHTWSHPNLTTLTATRVAQQIDETQAEIQSIIGETPDCVRPPYDAWNQSVLGEIAGRGLRAMSYSVDPRDWSMPGVTAIVSGVVGAAFPGAVVDMHDGGGTRSETVAALPRIITDLRAQGYGFVSVCGYLANRPPPQASAAYAFGQAPSPGTPITSSTPFAGASGTANGYWLTARDGGVFSFNAPFYGSMGATTLSQPVVGMAGDPATGGYWEVAADGGVFSFNAPFYGSMGGQATGTRFFAVVASPGGTGYLLIGEHPATSG